MGNSLPATEARLRGAQSAEMAIDDRTGQKVRHAHAKPGHASRVTNAELLVLAPRFPSINQPWIDTYLEQLEKQGVRYCVGSRLTDPVTYQDKVDRLGLRARSVSLPTSLGGAVLSAVAGLVTHPFTTPQFLHRGWRGPAPGVRARSRAGHALRSYHDFHRLRHLTSLRVVHAHSIAMAYSLLPMAITRRLPMVLTFHGLEPSGVPQVPEYQRSAVFRYSTKVLVNTLFARDHAISLGCPPEKLVVIPQGLALEDFPFNPTREPVSQVGLQVLTVGRFHPDKGQRFALLALKRLVAAGLKIRWHLAGVGQKEHLVTLVKKLQLEPFVEFHEGVAAEELKALYRRCHLHVLCSVGNRGRIEHVETQGVVLQEAQASGCIPIATRVGGIPECISDGIDGVLVRDRSHREIERAVLRILERSDRWGAMREAGRQNVEQRFGADSVGARVVDVLRDAMKAD